MITYFGYIAVLFGTSDDGDEPPDLLGTLIRTRGHPEYRSHALERPRARASAPGILTS
ncbi:hypothetical protein GCM10009555_051490 [Acrocarpospora macrocephala]|uniref:Uncharacterized protein n=1 Tax=Acrocarpospora macrocephala TaxID=150177 RepID=A0A5M3X7B5_9ACTN|nr:hypothetical protein [Acrocarpospora macrocephala]GES16994.1 hypothetical protein Amac_105920 [Acrocarpospora macrocephala]